MKIICFRLLKYHGSEDSKPVNAHLTKKDERFMSVLMWQEWHIKREKGKQVIDDEETSGLKKKFKKINKKKDHLSSRPANHQRTPN